LGGEGEKGERRKEKGEERKEKGRAIYPFQIIFSP